MYRDVPHSNEDVVFRMAMAMQRNGYMRVVVGASPRFVYSRPGNHPIRREPTSSHSQPANADRHVIDLPQLA